MTQKILHTKQTSVQVVYLLLKWNRIFQFFTVEGRAKKSFLFPLFYWSNPKRLCIQNCACLQGLIFITFFINSVFRRRPRRLISHTILLLLESANMWVMCCVSLLIDPCKKTLMGHIFSSVLCWGINSPKDYSTHTKMER